MSCGPNSSLTRTRKILPSWESFQVAWSFFFTTFYFFLFWSQCGTVYYFRVVIRYLHWPHIQLLMFSGIFQNLIEFCCGECWKVNLTAKVSRQSITAGKIPSYIDIALPFSTVDAEAVEHGMTFVSLVANPSVVYITKKSSASAIPRKLIAAVWNAWPVLVMALLLSLVSGVFLWFLVSIMYLCVGRYLRFLHRRSF